ncbi:pyridoxal phosphate-dependent aminotransferase [Acinetobacter sp. WZC-1]|uniref:pyridoxal phosphate-dependent aminotransferase n=1 Tax=Acinetobacter sp. WZC-1 TaxID=3459034 RepID=UPI00403D58D3
MPISSLLRDVALDLKPIRPFTENTESKGTLYLQNNENPYGDLYKRYPGYRQDGLDGLARKYLDLILHIDRSRGASPQQLNDHHILLTLGASGALETVFKTFFEPRVDHLLMTPPNFGLFHRIARIHGIGTRTVPLQGTAFDRLDVTAICNSDAKGVVLCDPNNPVGSRINPADIELLVKSFPGLIIIDEAYVEYSRYCSNLRHLQTNPNVVIIRTMSKALALAGLRIGAVIAHADIIQPLRHVQLPFMISSATATIASRHLDKRQILLQRIQDFQQERDRVFAALKESTSITGAWGEDGGFITLATNDPDQVTAILHQHKIQPVFNPEGLHGYIRISLGSPRQNNRVIKAFQSIR